MRRPFFAPGFADSRAGLRKNGKILYHPRGKSRQLVGLISGHLECNSRET
ncbi:MAG TPA: hypothetical protein VFF95_08055 [Candidatus Binatus sp.]|nr:hypothetical protein [Candidatus Binatus sp.]